jgi:hypothetical protein
MATTQNDRTAARFFTYQSAAVNPTVAVVEGISAVTGRPMEDLPPITSAVDPDALNTLCTASPSAASATVSFTYAGHDVTVSTSGSITIDPADS